MVFTPVSRPKKRAGKTVTRTHHRRHTGRQRYQFFFLFSAPWWLLGFVGLTIFPLGYSLWLSFTKFDGYTTPLWIGWSNYLQAFHDPLVWNGFQRTFLYMVIVVPLGLVGALILALMLNHRWRFIGIFRTIYYLPSVVPIVGVGLTFQMLFSGNSGFINTVLGNLHMSTVDWLQGSQAFVVLILMVLWGMGGGMIITLAGLQTVPVELLEAATIDGASSWKRFWSVTLPMLSPVLFFELITGIIGSLQIMIQPMLLVPGLIGVGGGQMAGTVPLSNQVYLYHVYNEVFIQDRFGYGSALIWMLFVAILLLTLLVFSIVRRWIYYESAIQGDL